MIGYLNDLKQQFMINSYSWRTYEIHNYNTIKDLKATLIPTTINEHHYITRGVVGSIIAGPAGLVVGALTGKKNFDAIEKLEIYVRFYDGSSFTKKIIDTPTKIDSNYQQKLVENFQKVKVA